MLRSIRSKLVVAFIAVAVVAGVIGYIGWSALTAAKADYDYGVGVLLPGLQAVTVFQDGIAYSREVERNLVMSESTYFERDRIMHSLGQKLDEVNEAWKTYDALPKTTEEQAIWQEFAPIWNQWQQEHQSFLELVKKGTKESMDQAQVSFFGKTGQAYDSLDSEMTDLRRLKVKQTQDRTSETQARMATSTVTLGAAIVFGVLLAIFFGFFLSSRITRGIGKVVTVAREIARGDLTRRIEVTSKDEIGVLAASFNELVDSLQGIIEQLSEGSARIASASQELSTTSDQLSHGADTQFQQSQQIAAAMRQMSASILEVAKNAQDAADAAKEAAGAANNGSTVVSQTIDGFKEIALTVEKSAVKVATLGDSSTQIGEIIEVIDDIADQTNLLALNAAIEAARAGEQGRGFAVVADEVRKLAERTTKATKEIANRITAIQKQTQDAIKSMDAGRSLTARGVEMANRAEGSLTEIVQLADRVGGMVALIATAAEEQSASSEQINDSVENIAGVIRQTGDGARQSAKATEELAQLALDQQSIVGKFKLDAGAPEEQLSIVEERESRAA